MSRSPIPHDALFKKFLGHPETARDFLDIHLPKPLRALCDLATLRLEPGSFVEPALRSAHSDILYSLKTTQGEGYIYCLIEHQSTPDPLMAFRLMRYSILAMQSHLDKSKDKTLKKLPLVIPILFYHGQVRPYPHGVCWLENFVDPEAARVLYGGPFPLVDVTAMADDEILRHKRVALLELVQKHIRQRDLLELLEPLARLLRPGGATGEQLETLLNYMLQVGNTANPQVFTERLAYLLPEHREKMMTIAEQLERIGWEKGRMAGREEGREEGWEEGRVEGEAAVLARQLSRRFGPLPEWAQERLRRAGAAQLEAWADAVLEAASLAEVMGVPPNSH
jgi:predicted transposase/invertase (TIGR01784 family)